MNYKSGVYKHVTGSLLGGHAVKVVGWGVEGQTKYWIAANSWSATWGENGFFRIEEGQCEFELNAVSCVPKIRCAEDESPEFLQF
jgi:cathepsin B